jgi:hypothetical protein
LNTAIAVISLITTMVVLSMAWRFFHNEPPWLEERIEGLLGTFFEPDENGKNMVDAIGARLGASIKGGLMGHASGEARHEKMLEKRVFSAVVEKSPELQIGIKALEQFGLEDLATPENLPALLSLANKYGLFGMLKGNSPGESSHGEGVM